MEKKKNIFKHSTLEIKKVDEDKREITVIGSKEISDRDNDIIFIDGIDLKGFRKNPSILWSHNHYDLPIGKALKVWKEGKELWFKIQFPEEEVSSFADTVYKLVKGGYIKSSSIGFAPDWKEAEYNEKRGGYNFPKTELLELSLVNVPANPAALIQSKGIQQAITDKVVNSLELDEFETYLTNLLPKEKDVEEKADDNVEEDMENVIDEAKKLIKDIDKEDKEINPNEKETSEHNNEVKCVKCGHVLTCPECDALVEKEEDLFEWIFKEEEKPEEKEESDSLDDLFENLG